jgi:biotin operon repressor
VRDRLAADLTPFRNREAAFFLATFVARFWSAPRRIVEGFVIDRRELADREDLGLSEAKVRGAIRVLEEIGFLDRAVASGSKYKATEDGLRRKPIRFEFGSEYAPAFIKANGRAAAVRGGHSGERRAITPDRTPRPSTTIPRAQKINSPKCKSEAVLPVNLGDLRKESGLPPKAFEPNPKLEAALDHLLQGIRQSRGSGEGSARRDSEG